MTQLLSLSRAARLAGVTRAELQRRIRRGEIQTFEGEIAVSDLLRDYPSVSLEKTGMLEQVEHIKAAAVPRNFDADTELPSPEVLVSRIHSLSKALGQKVALVEAQDQLLDELHAALASAAEKRESAAALLDWFDQRRTQIAAQPVAEDHTRLLAKDTFLRIMSASVKIIPSGHEFFVDGAESILEAAVRSGLRMSYGCSSGNCGACKVRIVSGDVWKLNEHDYVLSEREKQMGYVLACCHTAITDILLEAAEARSVDDLPEQEIRAQIRKLEHESSDLIILHVQTPRTQTLRFMAGQRARLTLDTGASVELPIASCPCNGRNLQFAVRRDGNDFSHALFEQASARQPIDLKGPYGSFVLHEDATDPAIFIAVDDGIAPIKSLIEHAISIDTIEAFYLYWSVQEPEEHYHRRWCRALQDTLDNFTFKPLIAADADTLMALLRLDLTDLPGLRFYLAGSSVLISSLRSQLVAAGVTDDRIASEIV